MSRYAISSVSIGDLIVDAGLDSRVTYRGADVALVKVSGITQDSRDVGPGDIYCCVRGEHFDGHDFAVQAVQAGAKVLVVDRDVEVNSSEVVVVHVDDVRSVLGHLACAAFGRPSESLTMVGITGTNGKTSVAAMVSAILTHCGHRVETIGTLTGVRTTPEAIDLQAQLRQCVLDGISHVVMEVSSHALAQHRVSGMVFDVAVLTNIGRDHLDFHGTEEAYFAAKARLFEAQQSRHGVVNVDDARGQLLCDVGPIDMTTFSRADASDVRMEIDRVSFLWRGEEIVVPMGGAFSVMNALAAATTAEYLHISPGDIATGLASLPSIPGRFQSVPNNSGIGVIVDYAHTPDGLAQVLETARAMSAGKVIVVFGCGGDRDMGKRPLMGETASRLADVVVVTSDNPRSENPDEIIRQVVAGIPADSRTQIHEFTDRQVAITSAISLAKRGDIVVIAGKGHELTQEVNGVHQRFSDVEQAHEALAQKGGTSQ